MNTAISRIGNTQAMEGQNVFNSFATNSSKVNNERFGTLPNNAAEVTKNLEENLETTKATAQELQRLFDMVKGNKLRFNVNSELDEVVVTVVDSATNEIIRQIPSEDLQKLQLRMKQAIGVLFDEII